VAGNVNPNQTVLRDVATGGKGASAIRKMVVILNAADAPGEKCKGADTSAPTSVNLRMVDDDGHVLIDSAKTIVCKANEQRNLKRDVLWQSPQNCADSAVPGGGSTDGDITATVSIAVQPDYVETLNIKCFE